MRLSKNLFLACAAGVGILLTTSLAEAQTIRAHTTTAGAAPNTTMKLLARYAEDAGLDVQVVEGQRMPRSMLLMRQGQLEMMTAIMNQYASMQAGQGAFADMAEQGAEAAAFMRSLFEFGAASQHFFTWADSRIETFDDLSGKTVYTGPGGGGASVEIEEMIRLMTGLVAGDDYTAIRAPWSEGMDAMRNGQVDAMVRIAPVGAAIIQEFGLSRGIRFLSISDEQLEAIAQYIAIPGRAVTEIPADAYEGMANDSAVRTLSFAAAMAVGADMEDDVAYTLTAAFWDNIDEIRDSAVFLRELDPAEPFDTMIIPLHPGAIRYYEEQGVEIADTLRP